MDICETCGNHYHHSFFVRVDGKDHCSAHCGRSSGERGLCDHVLAQADSAHWSI